MNDLTKDELNILLLEMNIVIQRTTNQGILNISPIYFELRDKIQAMIDNYCEHEFDMTDWANDSSGCRWYECNNCKGFYR